MEFCKDTSMEMNDGYRIPVVGFGTYAPDTVPKSKCEEAVKVAIEVGYRYIDGAYLYENEEEVGRAIREKIADGTVKREDIFYTGKAMEACKDAGLVKSIGVSNFNRRQLEMILNKPGLKYKPVCNQVECHPYLNQRKLLEFCKSKNIVLVAFSALGSHRDERWVDQSTPLLLEDPILNALAKKYNRSPALVALRYQLQRGVVVLAKSFTREHIEDNFKVFDFQLTEEDMKAIDSLNQNLRYDPYQGCLDHPEYPFADDY
ncbi:aldo-keto reductase family 1 member C3 homolog [Terrapene carolina triunguis]|uniref:aldo-keto reductase family 1 member C3 homolog n=1 Tax=Terrapene triunguis TaxID=2587831 RepID=UPI000E774957|nr:aldo-keto reductase family 1 member C3 homolog [Terrapene carolina triunguis]